MSSNAKPASDCTGPSSCWPSFTEYQGGGSILNRHTTTAGLLAECRAHGVDADQVRQLITAGNEVLICNGVIRAVDLDLPANASLDRPAASAGTVGGFVGLLPVGLIPIPPMILQEANRRAMEHGDLTFGHGMALGLALCATWGLCAAAIWIKRAVVRRIRKANATLHLPTEAQRKEVR
jgi:hypothetical protein